LQNSGLSAAAAETIIVADYCHGFKKRDRPAFLKKAELGKLESVGAGAAQRLRQLKHQSAPASSPVRE
jgi:hypothetical protein